MQTTNDELRDAVEEELEWDPKVDSSAVAVSADAGVITLRGTVGAYTEKCEAKYDAQRVRGVLRVEDELVVELLDEYRRSDADLRGAVLQALTLNSFVPSTIDAKVDDGWVTLTGTASSQFQRAEAEHVAGRVRAACGLSNDVQLVPFGPNAGSVASAIMQTLQRHAGLDASNISVQSSSGTVTLSGSVSTWVEHDD